MNARRPARLAAAIAAMAASDVGAKALAAKRLWRCRFCRTWLRVRAGLVRCPACRQDTVVAEDSAA